MLSFLVYLYLIKTLYEYSTLFFICVSFCFEVSACHALPTLLLLYLLLGFFSKRFVGEATQPKGVYTLKNLVPATDTMTGVVDAMVSSS